MSRGREGLMLSASSFVTCRATSTVLAPERFRIIIMMARRSFTRTIRRSSAKPSSTSATSRSRTNAPSRERITMSPISSGERYSPGTRIV